MNQFLGMSKNQMIDKKLRIIVNADDLGISPYVNSQIEQGINKGVITSSTIMANSPFFNEGVLIAKKYPQVSVGVHLNIIQFAPLTNTTIFSKYGLTDSEGNFVDGAIFVVTINKELQQAIFEEWDAQISKVESSGIFPTHCDSHQHTHTIPQLRKILCMVLDKHHIRRVRRKSVPSIRLMLRERKKPSVILDKSKTVKPPKRNILYRRFHLLRVVAESWTWNYKMGKKYEMAE